MDYQAGGQALQARSSPDPAQHHQQHGTVLRLMTELQVWTRPSPRGSVSPRARPARAGAATSSWTGDRRRLRRRRRRTPFGCGSSWADAEERPGAADPGAEFVAADGIGTGQVEDARRVRSHEFPLGGYQVGDVHGAADVVGEQGPSLVPAASSCTTRLWRSRRRR
jgi:hypothetical protein